MGLISLHRKYSFVDYQHHICSFASLFTLLSLSCAVLLPIICLVQLKNNQNYFIIYEQPMVKFQYKYLIIAENSMQNEDGKDIMCTSFEYLQQFKNKTEKCNKIAVSEKDTSVDGFADEIIFKIEFSTFHDFGVKSLSMVLFLDARLYEQCEFRVPTVIIMKKNFRENFNNRHIFINGKLEAEQDLALICPYFLRNVKSHFFFSNIHENQTDIEEYEISSIKERLKHNPMHFKFHEFSTDMNELDKYKTSIKLRIKIPEIPIRYKKSFWQKLMDVWMQFLALFIITFTIINFLLGHLFENRFIVSRRKNYIKDKEF
ncbi:hypothetical protein PVAND_004398 [Polypedilum vanderplanki]|uniref:Transmembrane protein 231 n=1 Tax=Polypedilum vanderplanki TaxID=319348 RepID=A0A9J6BXG1_POLVA|nr:hypothetical protein PVAND_004398 [Polypedilum vanderplanki]